MREIMFRGKDIKTGKWVHGALFDGCANAVIFSGFSIYKDDCWHVDPETVGQYTGLKDKNGVEIFEGDILGLECYKAIVRFGEYQSACRDEDCQLGFWLDFTECKKLLRKDFLFWIKAYGGRVIGNIHDNKELLEEKT